jgi:NRAMP (natural resistance-associated macrophage protein)-like metal ion transporter
MPQPDVDKRHPAAAFFKELGPGLITGAADDDPSGISTYSVTGAAFGFYSLWTALFSYPLMVAVQLMCARLGMVTGRGLAGNIRLRYPKWVMWASCVLLLVANIFNIGADLAGMSDSMELVTGVPSLLWTPFIAIGLVALVVFTSYRTVASIFKWLTLILFAYIITAFLVRPDWGEVFRATLVPHIQFTREYCAVLVGIFGTTISPYLFFWQASQEVEEERAMGRRTIAQRRGATAEEIARSRRDVATGMFFSNIVMYFIILTTAATLHAHGIRNIETAKQAAEALRPLAGNGAYLLFAMGIVGTGVLAIPVLAGSSAYAVAESMHWGASLDRPLKLAPKFYAVLAVAVALGMALDYAGINSVRMLFWSAVLNGLLAPPLIVLVVLLTGDKTVMRDRLSSRSTRILGWICAVVMTACAAGLLLA